MQQALLALGETEEGNDNVELHVATLDFMANSEYAMGNVSGALGLTNKLLQLRPDHINAIENKVLYENIVKEVEEEESNNSKKLLEMKRSMTW